MPHAAFTRRETLTTAAVFAAALTASTLSQGSAAHAAVTQGSGQIFPSMSSPASTLDLIDLSNSSFDERALFTTLQGLVNRSRPRIWEWYPHTDATDDPDEGKHTWPDALGLGYTDVTDPYSLLTKYRSSVAGLVIYDPAQPATLNVATSLAGLKNGVVVSPTLATKLKATPYGFTVLQDLRTNAFTSNEAVYDWAYTNVWPQLRHDFVIGLDPSPNSNWGQPEFSGFIRDYAVATKAMVLYLDAGSSSENAVLKKYFGDMTPGQSSYLGWFVDEGSGIGSTSSFGIGSVAADRVLNLSVLSGMSRTITSPPAATTPTLQKKIYVAVVLSDGDNLQYMQHHMKYLWENAGRGQVALNWTVAPTSRDLAPGIIDYYNKTSTVKDCLIAGPSGLQYTYPDQWPSTAALKTFLDRSSSYFSAIGITGASVWGSTEGYEQQAFASIPTLKVLTTQSTDSGATHFWNGRPVVDLVPSYTGSIADLKSRLDSVAASWNGDSPAFVAMQLIGWNRDGSDLVSFLKGLDSRFSVVRLDQFASLAVAAEQPAAITNGLYRLDVQSSGLSVGVAAGSTSNGATVDQETWTSSGSQKWTVTATSNGYYKLVNLASGRSLAVDGASLEAPHAVIQWDYGTAQNDQWKFVAEGNGSYKLVNRLSSRVLEVSGASTSPGASLEQFRPNDGSNQRFILRPLNA